MANNDTLKTQLQEKKNNQVSAKSLDLKTLLATPTMQKRFDEVLKSRAPQFTSTILNLVNNDSYLRQAEPTSIIGSAMVAATLDLPIDKNLGYAWIVPFKDKNAGGIQKAQFILGYKGYIQLALRTGQYKAINAVEVHEGELVSWNPLTEEMDIDFSQKKSNVVIGYAGYFELLNGFKKSVYWTKEQITAHKNRFSKTAMVWNVDFDSMALKTVIKNMLSKWGILSIEMQSAFRTDENEVKEVKESGEIDVVDIEFEIVDADQGGAAE
jgi:recombination protein RecT